MRFQPGHDLEATPGEDAILFAFAGDRLLVAGDPPLPASMEHLGDLAGSALYIGMLDGRPCFSIPLDASTVVPDGLSPFGLRELFGRLDPHMHGAAGRAYQLAEWYRSHAFCGRCGHPTKPSAQERARTCESCGQHYFPRINPAVIFRVDRDDATLLARNASFRGPFFSVLAGFVEPGETLEETVVRETHEEAGLEVGAVRYFGSQSWPFPSQLMVGFVAEWKSGEIDLRDSELAEARWFRRGDELPGIPGRFSISRRLIDDFFGA
jgi:NAD+ diphosphatase